MSISVLEALAYFKKPALVLFIGLTGFAVGIWINITYFNNSSPIQPIAFSHKIHAGDNKIPCQYCHVYASRTPSAGVPSVQKCMGCHRSVATDKAEIIKVAQYYADREPIPWIKVHDVPDFVHFTHKRHIKAGLKCQECHGPVETMDRIQRQQLLRMPWCIDCHTRKKVENGRDCWTCHK